MKYYYEVALPLNLQKNLIYFSDQKFLPGESVKVSLRNKTYLAVILKPACLKSGELKKRSFKIKPILSKNSLCPRLSPARLKWLFWLSDYYQHSLGMVIHLSFPSYRPPVRKNKKQEAFRLQDTDFCKNRDSLNPKNPPLNLIKPSLTKEQKLCLKNIAGQGEKGFSVHLLHGVTGSGKTEIYFRLIEPCLKEQKSALILVPEIALTPQHTERFSCRFPSQVACLHSGLSPKQKYLEWRKLVLGEKKILIGARSALFCPLPRLSWIIVDEEHESSFKQEEKLKYHARDSAVALAKFLNIPLLLSSATPSLESCYNAQKGKYIYHRLKSRVFKTPPPRLEVVDMKKEEKSHFLPKCLSNTLYQALKSNLENKKQSALFLNRRGESAFVFCLRCGRSLYCLNCDISLTQHQSNHLLCHYCGFREEQPESCLKCGGELCSFGVGTAGLQKDLELLFPTARILRADRDAVKNHKEWEEVLKKIEDRSADILIGTQMIAKGLDFPGLTLMGLILADQGLNYPDFRAKEKNFQLITQVAGRSGRRKETGRVILQSFNPSHPVMEELIKGDYQAFVKRELKEREKRGWPPFGRLTLLRVESLSEVRARSACFKIQDRLKNIKGLTILGPAPAPLKRLISRYRYHLLLKSGGPALLKKAEKALLTFKSPSAVELIINKDPVNMF